MTTPGAAEDFESACLLFELPWYADVPTGGAENARIRELSATVLAVPVEAPLHAVGPSPVVGVAGIPIGAGGSGLSEGVAAGSSTAGSSTAGSSTGGIGGHR